MKPLIISEQGGRSKMEDCYFFEKIFFEKGCTFILICDGHGGKLAAKYTVKNMPVLLKKLLKEKEPEVAFKIAYQQISDEICRKSISGTTALGLLIKNKRKIFYANAGDCRAIIVKTDGFEQLTEDHRLDNEKEEKRLKELGTKLENSCVYNREGEWIEPTRTIGDVKFKSVGVIATPDTGQYEIKPTDLALVVASDGLFGSLGNEEVADLVREVRPTKEIAKALKDFAFYRYGWDHSDNLTAIVIFLKAV